MSTPSKGFILRALGSYMSEMDIYSKGIPCTSIDHILISGNLQFDSPENSNQTPEKIDKERVGKALNITIIQGINWQYRQFLYIPRRHRKYLRSNQLLAEFSMCNPSFFICLSLSIESMI